MEATLWDIKPKSHRKDPQIYQEIGRFVSRTEALKIARQILEEAERERIAIADFEAARGIKWEMIVPGEIRICSVNGTRMRTWNPAPDGGSRGDGSPRLEVTA